MAGTVALLSFQVRLDIGGDNGEYLALAKALSTRQGYRMIAEPGEPLETKRWPGYPVLLAGWMLLLGSDIAALKAASVVCFAAGAALTWMLLRRQAGSTPWLALAGLALVAMNPEALHYASTLFSEMLFLLLTVAALLALEKTAEGDRPWAWAAATALSAIGAIYTRPQGLVLVPTAFVFLAVSRRWAQAIAVPAVMGLALLPWMWRQTQATVQGQHTYLARTLAQTEEDAPEASGLAKYAYRVGRNGAVHFLSMGRTVLTRPRHIGFVPFVPPAPQDDDEVSSGGAADEAGVGEAGFDAGKASRYLLAAVVVLGAVVSWRRRGSALHWYLILTFVLLLVAPWPRARYLVPLLPVFAWFLLSAVRWLPRLLRRWLDEDGVRKLGAAGVAAVVALALLLGAMFISQQLIANLQHRGLPHWAPERYVHEGLDIANYMRAVAWLRDNTPADAIVVARKPYQVYWVAGRQSDVVWNESVEGAWKGFLDMGRFGRPVYVIEDAFNERFDPRAQARSWWGPALRAHAGAGACLLFETDPPHVRVWRIEAAVPRADALSAAPAASSASRVWWEVARCAS
ncbi:MAG: glycosyltransferase family 39 protein [Armatimonadota bacterium]